MKMMLNVSFPHEKFNEYVKDGTAGQKIETILNDINPIEVYFTEKDGRRAAVLIVDLESPSDVPRIAEPWFLSFNADVEIRIVMSKVDLKNSGLDELGEKWL